MNHLPIRNWRKFRRRYFRRSCQGKEQRSGHCWGNCWRKRIQDAGEAKSRKRWSRQNYNSCVIRVAAAVEARREISLCLISIHKLRLCRAWSARVSRTGLRSGLCAESTMHWRRFWNRRKISLACSRDRPRRRDDCFMLFRNSSRSKSASRPLIPTTALSMDWESKLKSNRSGGHS